MWIKSLSETKIYTATKVLSAPKLVYINKINSAKFLPWTCAPTAQHTPKPIVDGPKLSYSSWCAQLLHQ